jgi:hypothetical protein
MSLANTFKSSINGSTLVRGVYKCLNEQRKGIINLEKLLRGPLFIYPKFLFSIVLSGCHRNAILS